VPAAVGDFLILRALRESGGTAVAVSDQEIIEAANLIGRTQGMFVCPEGAAMLVALQCLCRQGWIGDDETVLLFNTGSGLKYAVFGLELSRLLGANVVHKSDMRGPVYAVLSAMATAVAPIATKQALETVNLETFSVLWSLSAFIVASTYALGKRGSNTFRMFRQYWPFVLAIGVLTAAIVLIDSMAVRLVDPTLVSFFTRFEVVFTVLLGMLLFKERLNRLELLGVTTTISGALIMSYRAGEIVFFAFVLGLINSLFVSIRTLLGKVAVQYLEPAVLVAVSRLIACLFTLLYAIAFGVLQLPSSTNLLIIIIGAFSGPFLGFMLLYKALSLSEVSRVSVFRTSFPFFVALYSLLLFHTIPSPRQMLGGGIVVAGILVLISGRRSGWSHNKDSTVSM